MMMATCAGADRAPPVSAAISLLRSESGFAVPV
jgi:hypothetical protein